MAVIQFSSTGDHKRLQESDFRIYGIFQPQAMGWQVNAETPTTIDMSSDPATPELGAYGEVFEHIVITGQGFTYDEAGMLTAGLITGIDWTRTDSLGTERLDLTGGSVTAELAREFYDGSTLAGWALPFHTDDLVLGTAGEDCVQGWGGADTISAGDGGDYVLGHALGQDTSSIPEAIAREHNYLRGDGGNDTIAGSYGFDDINGNMGDDLAHGHGGGDWVVAARIRTACSATRVTTSSTAISATIPAMAASAPIWFAAGRETTP